MTDKTLETLKSELLAEFEEVIMPLEKMWANQIKQQEVHRWEIMYGFTPAMLRKKVKSFLSSALSTVAEKTAEAVEIGNELDIEKSKKKGIIFELTEKGKIYFEAVTDQSLKRDKWLGRGNG